MSPFRIQTLSSLERCNTSLSSRSRLGFDPVSIITGGGALLNELFPNLFGSERLTMQHLNALFPSNGFYTNAYKNFLLQRIRYVKDVQRDLHMYTGQFIESRPEICAGGSGNTCWQNFYKILEQESITGGTQPVGNVLGIGIDWQTILLIGGGVLLLVALSRKKNKK